LPAALQVRKLLPNQRTQLPVSLLLPRCVADAAPRKQVGTVSHVKVVRFAPANKFQVTVFGFHLLDSRHIIPMSRPHVNLGSVFTG
jgi:hypothetical protein